MISIAYIFVVCKDPAVRFGCGPKSQEMAKQHACAVLHHFPLAGSLSLLLINHNTDTDTVHLRTRSKKSSFTHR